MLRSLTALLAILATAATAAAEFQISEVRSSYYTTPAVVADASGNVTAVWSREDPVTFGEDMVARRFNGFGSLYAPEFQVNASPTGSFTHYPVVGTDAFGNFGFSWLATGGIKARRYFADGTPGDVTEFTVTSQIGTPAVIGRGAFGSVGAWAVFTTGNNSAVFASVDLGVPFQVNTQNGFGVVDAVDVAQDASSNFVIVWQSSVDSFSRVDVFGRRYNSAGTPLGGEFQISQAADVADWPVVAMTGPGNFMVVWRARNVNEIRGRLYASNGVALAPEFQIDTDTTGSAYVEAPDVAALSDGSYVATWSVYDPAIARSVIRSRHYAANGALLRSCGSLDSNSNRFSGSSAITATPDGGYVVVWDGGTTEESFFGPFVTGWDVFAQRGGPCGAGFDMDGDGVCDVADNCPCAYNPDQRNTDASGGGDVCDGCPSNAADTCDQTRSASATIDASGGTLRAGAVQIDVPPGTVGGPTSFSITSLTASEFGVGTQGPTLDIVKLQPENVAFAQPIAITFGWSDTDDDGDVDNTANPRLLEGNLRVYRNGQPITRQCDAPSCGAAQCTASNTCALGSGPAGACCDRAANEWTVPVTSFSEYLLLELPCAAHAEDLACAPGTSRITIKDNANPARNSLVWTDQFTGASLDDFLNPTVDGGNDYAFCLYDSSTSQLLGSARIPAGGTCGTKPCWKATPTSLKYNRLDALEEGISSLVLSASRTGKGKITLKGKGAALDMPAPPLSLPLLATLQSGNSCWAAQVNFAQRNQPGVFRGF